jgi:hypothetical protein
MISLALVAATTSVGATTLVPADLGELSREARVIARGRIAAVDAQWTESRRTIETIVTLDVETYLKGTLGDVVRFRVPGGLLGRYRSVVVGAPHFVAGQRVIVFLGVQGPTIPYVLGLSQGVFRISPVASGELMVNPPVVLPSMRGPIVRGSLAMRPVMLADFEQTVRALAEGAQ